MEETTTAGREAPAWWGEKPALGTRRHLIGDAIAKSGKVQLEHIGPIRDAVELALQESMGDHPSTDDRFGPGDGAEEASSPCRFDKDDVVTGVGDRVPPMLVTGTRWNKVERQWDVEVLHSNGGRGRYAEDVLKPWADEVHVVLKNLTNANLGQPPRFEFVELEDASGKSIGGFDWREEGGFDRIVIPASSAVLGLVDSSARLLRERDRLKGLLKLAEDAGEAQRLMFAAYAKVSEEECRRLAKKAGVEDGESIVGVELTRAFNHVRNAIASAVRP